ncbi:MAG: hypothetical protein MJ097_08095, partial [Dorea sp.]|nr:hypothetical protein [Dorea sp.]
YTIRELEHLISRRITPVIAHLDRYYSYQKDMDEMEALFDLPVEIQFNGDCLESFTKRRKFYQFLNKHGMCLLGTDAHNMTDRRPNLKNARNQIEKKFGPEMLAELDEYSEHLLFNR